MIVDTFKVRTNYTLFALACTIIPTTDTFSPTSIYIHWFWSSVSAFQALLLSSIEALQEATQAIEE